MIDQYVTFSRDLNGYKLAKKYLLKNGANEQQLEDAPVNAVIDAANQHIVKKQIEHYESNRRDDSGETADAVQGANRDTPSES